MPGTLYLIATPIGNLEDITLRALRILRQEVSAIACEDTRQTSKLLEHFGIQKPLLTYHEHNEQSRTADLVERLQRGDSIALVSDAGTPLVSDPGYRVVTAAIAASIPVTPLPGASAVLCALAGAGLPTDEFRFVGFLPAKSGQRRRMLQELATERATVVCYESPHRILEALQDMAEAMPSNPIVVARELTKLHEEFLRGSASEVQGTLAARPSIRGEFTIVIGRAVATAPPELDPLAEIARLQAEGVERMEAIKTVAKRLGLPKREVYRLFEERDNSLRDKRRG